MIRARMMPQGIDNDSIDGKICQRMNGIHGTTDESGCDSYNRMGSCWSEGSDHGLLLCHVELVTSGVLEALTTRCAIGGME